jgi:hypothetical protein
MRGKREEGKSNGNGAVS